MNDFLAHLSRHILLAGSALAIGLVVGGIIGSVAFDRSSLRRPLLAITALLRVIPSLAIFLLCLPFLGIGIFPALVALGILATAPVAIAVDSALRSVSPPVMEAATAMGMTARELRYRVIWPLALPRVLGGVRTAAVEAIASTALAAFIGAGGLGDYVVEGLATEDTLTLLKGGVAIALLALLTEFALSRLERFAEALAP